MKSTQDQYKEKKRQRTTTGVVVEVSLNVTADNTSQCPHEFVDLSGIGTTNSIGNTNSVDTDLVDGPVDREQIDEFGSERVLRGESDLNTLGLDELNNLNSAMA